MARSCYRIARLMPDFYTKFGVIKRTKKVILFLPTCVEIIGDTGIKLLRRICYDFEPGEKRFEVGLHLIYI